MSLSALVIIVGDAPPNSKPYAHFQCGLRQTIRDNNIYLSSYNIKNLNNLPSVPECGIPKLGSHRPDYAPPLLSAGCNRQAMSFSYLPKLNKHYVFRNHRGDSADDTSEVNPRDFAEREFRTLVTVEMPSAFLFLAPFPR